MVSSSELSRYVRQLALPEVGLAGQERLRAARVCIVGAGGLGSPAALYLAAAGVGTIGIVDDDVVDVGNLHRQIAHTTSDVGRHKAVSAAEAIGRLNPSVTVQAHQERLDPPRALTRFRDYELVVDGSDNFTTRYAVNDACAQLGIPWVYGSVERFSGQVSLFGVAGGPCYRCVFPEAPAPGSTPTCDEIGVLGAVPGVIGSLQAVEALKYILGIGDSLVGRLLQVDVKRMDFRMVHLDRRRDCAACGEQVSAPDSREARGADGAGSEDEPDIHPGELAERLRGPTPSELVLLDVREPWEWAMGSIGGSMCLPMGQLEEQVGSLDRGRELIVYCHHGTRSAVAAHWLRRMGFRARNLQGGIDRWSREIDPGVPRY